MMISLKRTKKRTEENGSITLRAESASANAPKEETLRRLILWGIGTLLQVSFCGVILSLLQVPFSAVFLGLWCGACMGLCFYGYDKPRLRRGAALFAAVAAVLIFLLFGGLFRDGFGIVLNGIKDLWGAAFRLIYLRSAVSGDHSAIVAVSVFLMMPLAMASALTAYVVLGKGRLFLFLALSVLFILLIPAHTSPSPVWYSLFALALSLLTLVGVSGISSRSGSGTVLLFPAAVMAFVMAVLCLLPLTGIFPNGYGKPTVCSAVEAELSEFAVTLTKGRDETNNLPAGKTAELGPLERTEETALEVTMSDPCSLYLRGYVGSDYTAAGWSSLDNNALYEYADTFYWLHNDGFYGTSQLAAAAEAAGRTTEPITVTVRSVHAGRRYIYAPYEYTDGNTGKAASRIGDESPSVADYDDPAEVTYTIVSNQVKTASELSQSLREQASAGTAETTAYLENEKAYRAFVYDMYLTIPEETRSVLKTHLGAADLSSGHAPYDDAMQAILDELLTNTVYNEEVSAPSEGTDLCRDFLETGGEGYSVHYATATALMFRYFGIPARYVEGYIITPEDANSAESGEPMALSGENAHAWAEYYRDGVGWIPFETTPPYLFIMEQPGLIREQISDTLDTQSNQQGMVQMDQDNYEDIEEEEEESPPEKETTSRSVLWLIVGIFLCVLTGAFLLLWYRRRKALAEYRRELAEADDRLGVDLLFRDTLRLLAAGGLKRKNGSLTDYEEELRKLGGEGFSLRYGMAVRLHREAVFSDHPVSPQRRYVFSLLREEAKAFAKEHSRYGKRWVDRYIRHLY